MYLFRNLYAPHLKLSSFLYTQYPGISEIMEAYQATSVSLGLNDDPQQNGIQEKANMISNHIRTDQATAVGKIQDALKHLGSIVLSTSMPTI